MSPAEREKLFQERKAKYGHILEPFPRLTDEDKARLFPQVAEMISNEQLELPLDSGKAGGEMLTLAEYMDLSSFPVTSLPRYSGDPKTQILMDAFNLDQLNEAIEMGQPLNDKQRAVLQELKQKEPHMQRLSKELREQEKTTGT